MHISFLESDCTLRRTEDWRGEWGAIVFLPQCGDVRSCDKQCIMIFSELYLMVELPYLRSYLWTVCPTTPRLILTSFAREFSSCPFGPSIVINVLSFVGSPRILVAYRFYYKCIVNVQMLILIDLL